MGLEIKDYKVLRALMSHTYHPTLISLSMWCSVRHSKFLITSAFRDDDKNSVHGYGRGLDLRTKWWNENEINEIVGDINDHWEYDPSRPSMRCGAYHNKNHIHLKVHKNTIYHKEGRK